VPRPGIDAPGLVVVVVRGDEVSLVLAFEVVGDATESLRGLLGVLGLADEGVVRGPEAGDAAQ
jgi:hypothetical protein